MTRIAPLHTLTPVRDAAGNGVGVVEYGDARGTRSPWIAYSPRHYSLSHRMCEYAEEWLRSTGPVLDIGALCGTTVRYAGRRAVVQSTCSDGAGSGSVDLDFGGSVLVNVDILSIEGTGPAPVLAD